MQEAKEIPAKDAAEKRLETKKEMKTSKAKRLQLKMVPMEELLRLSSMHS